MFNTYTTNSVLWPRNHHGYCSLLPERSETYRLAKPSRSSPKCCCAASRSRCCCCCYSTPSFVKPKVSINPGFVLYGLRQSTLIQWPRRLMVGVDVGKSRLLGSEYDVHCCDSEVYGVTRRNRRFRVRVSEESSECCDRSCQDDVEAMISFLSEELVDEGRNCNRVEEKRKVRYGNGRKVETFGRFKKGVEGPQGFGRQEYKRNGVVRENVKLEEDKYECEHCDGRKKKSQLESEARRGSKLVTTGGETFRRKEEREVVRPIRTKSSSCSSYYSLASSGDFESESEAEDEEEDVEFRRENLRSSEKKQSTKGMKSRKEVSQMDSRRKREESSTGVSSSYRKQIFEEGETSNRAVTTNQRRRRKQISQTGNRVSESTGNYEEDLEIHEIHVNDAETNSQTQKIFGEREDERVHSIVNDSERENIESSQQQQLKERFGARYSSEERVSEMRRRTRYSGSQEEGIHVRQHVPKPINNRQPPVEERISMEAGMRTSTERFSESSEVHDTNIKNTYVSQREDQIRNQEVRAGLVFGLQSEERQQDSHIEQNQKTQSDRTSVSVSHTSDVVRYTEIERKSEERLIGQGSTTSVQLDSKAGKSGAWKDSRLEHANSTKKGQKALGLQSSQGKLSEESSSSQSSLTLVSGNRMQLVDLVSEQMQGSETTLIPPPSQLVHRGSGQSYGSGGAFIQESSQGTSETGYPTAFEHPGAGAVGNIQSAGELMRFTAQEDALGSAQRLEQSSEKFVGEFVKKAKHDVSTSETGEGRAESNQLKRRDSRRSSGGSGAKGPSDEMWVTDSAQGTPQPVPTEGNAAEGNAILKRNGRSLWSVIADIARLRWGSRAGSPSSSAKPTGKSSPNESVSSATWFSGREHDGSSEDNTKAERVSPQEAALPDKLEVSQTSHFESSDAMEQKQQSGKHGGVVSSPPSRILEGGSASYPIPSTSGNQIVGVDEGDEGREFEFRLSETASTEVPIRLPSRNLIRSPAIKDPSESSPTEVSTNQNVTFGKGKSYQARVPEMDAELKPLIFLARSLRSPVVKEPSQTRPSMVSGSSSLREQVEQQQPLSAKSQEEAGSTSTGSPLTQKKLQRNKQVVRDSFEEWEEAYRVEAERRTVDEIFMREALVEAKKAADMWEVPVGAVLVHDGKIIARGYNLVEDLRDSTAHAEMICIREGSKALRSWRLADTTLYVTLEPCPMCAGAILQARVNTLVWGAPNKLLGADGSWIRLFPGGVEGNGSEVSEKPPPPVHPFHPKMTIRRGVLESECAQTMQQFFQLRRKKKDKNSEPPAPTDRHHHHHPSKLLNKMHQILPFFCL